MLRCTIIGCTYLILILVSGAAFGQEYLNIGEAKYLGKRDDGRHFVTCLDTVMLIGNGTVTPTNKRCDKGLPPPIAGQVIGFDQMDNTVRIQDEHGNEHRAHLTDSEIRKILAAPTATAIEMRISQQNKKREMTLH